MTKPNRQQFQREPVNDFQRRVKLYLRANEDLQYKFGISSRPVIYFPTKRSIPLLCKIALNIIQNGGGIIDTKFDDLRKQ
jgi:phospholipid N-methyltransferase